MEVISVIVPAHNEETVIERCISSLLNGNANSQMEVIVACNGCTDRTAFIAKKFGPPVIVIELEQASKTKALNSADRAAHFFPRLYIDADVVLTSHELYKVVDFLKNQGKLLASPVAFTDLSRSSGLVRSFYRVWTHLPYNRIMVGTGIYALSREGRKRFKDFPDIIADDAYIRSLFSAEERGLVDDARVVVKAPETYNDLIKVKTRSRLGGYELVSKFPELNPYDSKKIYDIIKALPFSFKLPWDIVVYIWVNIIVRINAKKKLRNLSAYTWERDESSRLIENRNIK